MRTASLLLMWGSCVGGGCGPDSRDSSPDTIVVDRCSDDEVYLATDDAVSCLNVESLDLRDTHIAIPGTNLFSSFDMALAADGILYGIERDTSFLYRIDLDTGETTTPFLTELGSGLGALEDGRLVSAGGLYRDDLFTVDLASGETTNVARLDGSEGEDLVQLPDGLIYWAALASDSPAGWHLLRVDPDTWEISEVGPLTVPLAGLAYAGGCLLGFATAGTVYAIDPDTAEIIDTRELDLDLYGGGATARPWWLSTDR